MGVTEFDQTARTLVRRRRVFYLPGYDPFHPRRYRELYRKESAAQAEVSGYRIEQWAKREGGPYGWHVDAHIEGCDVGADVEVLVWSDIVRGSMSNSIPATYWQLVRTAWTYIASGALRRLMWLRKGPVIAALYPVGMPLCQLALAIVAGALLARGVTGGLGLLLPMPDWLDDGIGWSILLVVAVVVLRWFKAQDGKVFAYYLTHNKRKLFCNARNVFCRIASVCCECGLYLKLKVIKVLFQVFRKLHKRRICCRFAACQRNGRGRCCTTW